MWGLTCDFGWDGAGIHPEERYKTAFQAYFSQFPSRTVGRWNSSHDESPKNNSTASLFGRNLSTCAYCFGGGIIVVLRTGGFLER